MILTQATFNFLVNGHRWCITFFDDKIRLAIGDRHRVHILKNVKRPHRGRPFKPCVTHCEDLIRRYSKKPAATKQAKQRNKSLAKDNRKTLGIFRP